MKSKTSCFNRTIFTKNITMFWPLWVVYLAYLICSEPLMIWRALTADYYSSTMDATSKAYNIMESAVSIQITAIPTFLFAMAAGLAVFSYLYSSRNANMIHALPVNRKELYITNYLSGLTFLVVPQVVVFVITLLVCLANQITCIQYLFMGLLASLGVAFFAYSMSVFVAMFTGNIIAMPIFFLVLNYLYVGCLYLVDMIISTVNYGISDFWNPGKACVLSPMYYLNNNLRTSVVYGTNNGLDTIKGIEIQGLSLVAGYAVAAVVFAIVSYEIYRKRQIETAGDWVSIPVVKPIFRWGVGMCGGILLTMFLVYTLAYNSDGGYYFGWIVAGMVVFGCVCFFAAEMLLSKKFKVFHKKRIAECGVFLAVSVLFLTLFKLDAFGIERLVPDKDEIAAAFVNMDYPVEVTAEDMDEFLDLHRQIIADKKAYLVNAQNEKGYYYTTIRYYLKDGSTIERRYPLAVTEEYLEDSESPVSKFLEWESRKENLMYQLFGRNYEENSYYSGSMDRYNAQGEYNNYNLTAEETNRLVEAVQADIEDGNLAKYYLYSRGEDNESYINSFGFDFNNKNYIDNWNYYYRYGKTDESGYSDGYYYETAITDSSNSVNFGPDCRHMIETLKELGIIDDTWKLMTGSEYDMVTQ